VGALSIQPVPVQIFWVALITLLAFASWWWAMRLINRQTGVSIREQLENIKGDPLAVAVYRVGLMFSVAYLLAQLWSRFIG